MLRLTVTQGSAFNKVLDTFNDDQTLPLTFLDTDALRCDFWDGQDQAVLFNPTVSWNDASLGIVNYSFTNFQCELTEANGTYRVQVFAARDGAEFCIADFLQAVSPSVGASARTILAYCTYQDMLDLAPWITGVQDVDVDQRGFYSQRLKARLWLDDIVVQKFQSNFVGQFGAHSESAFSALGNYTSIGPDHIIIDALKADQLILRPPIVQVCAHFAVGQIGLAQIVTGNQNLMKAGQYHLAKANRDVLGITAEIDTNGDGIGEMFANLATVYGMLG